MREIYSGRWTAEDATTNDDLLTATAQTWCSGLAPLTMGEIGAGLAALVPRGDGWPPTLPEFHALCKPPRNALSRRVERAESERSAALPAPGQTITPGVADRYTAHIRAILRGEPGDPECAAEAQVHTDAWHARRWP